MIDLEKGDLNILNWEDMNFSYRSSILKTGFPRYFLVSCMFDLSEKKEKYHSDVDNIYFREHKQPKGNSCGSFFKNPRVDIDAFFEKHPDQDRGHAEKPRQNKTVKLHGTANWNCAPVERLVEIPPEFTIILRWKHFLQIAEIDSTSDKIDTDDKRSNQKRKDQQGNKAFKNYLPPTFGISPDKQQTCDSRNQHTVKSSHTVGQEDQPHNKSERKTEPAETKQVDAPP